MCINLDLHFMKEPHFLLSNLGGALTWPEKVVWVCPAGKTPVHASPAALQIPSCSMIQFFIDPTLSKNDKFWLVQQKFAIPKQKLSAPPSQTSILSQLTWKY